MKYIRPVSDLHLNFDYDMFHKTRRYTPGEIEVTAMDMLWYPPELPEDDDTALVIAGDLWTDRRFLTKKHQVTNRSWMGEVASRFKYVVFVLGNHDYWSGNVSNEAQRVQEELDLQELTNVHLLESSLIVLDQVKFVGGTLWTDFGNQNPLVMLRAPQIMNDYDKMRYGKDYGRCRPYHLYDIFNKTKDFIFKNALRDSPDQKVVVVTHMAPSYQSIDQYYRENCDGSNFLYYSDIEPELHDPEGAQINLWLHGHCHAKSNYVVNNTHIIDNPRGYRGYEETFFDDRLLLSVDSL